MRSPADREILLVSLRVEDRGDGGVLVTSRDVPGLYLSGAEPARVWSLVPAALQHLLTHNAGLAVVSVLSPPLPEDHPPLNVPAEVEVAVQLALAA